MGVPWGWWLLDVRENLLLMSPIHRFGVNPPGLGAGWEAFGPYQGSESSWEVPSYLFKSRIACVSAAEIPAMAGLGLFCSVTEGILGAGFSSPNWEEKKKKKKKFDSLSRSLLPARAGWDLTGPWLSPCKDIAQWDHKHGTHRKARTPNHIESDPFCCKKRVRGFLLFLVCE